MLHRPGPELSRLTPRNNDRLLFDGIPWVERAQVEHDAFAAALRSRGVEVLYLTDLVREALGVPEARGSRSRPRWPTRRSATTCAPASPALLADLDPADAGHRADGRAAPGRGRGPGRGRRGRAGRRAGAPDDFVIDPLPNLLFTRDSSAWMGDQVAVTSLAMPARRRETSLTEVIYRHHPRFAGTELAYEPRLEPVEGGDVLLLAPGVIAVGHRRADDAGRGRAAGPPGAEQIRTKSKGCPGT